MVFQYKISRPKPYYRRPQFSPTKEQTQEGLSGVVQGKEAFAPEERLARAIYKDRNVTEFFFRLSVIAPRGEPGWKELDFLIKTRDLSYAVEVDTPFTHRNKEGADVLHDAQILADLRENHVNVYPEVVHVDGSKLLLNEDSAKKWLKELIHG